MSQRPAGNSRAAGLRRLQRYAASPELCAARGIDHAAVVRALERCSAGQQSVRQGLLSCGLKASPWPADPTAAATALLRAYGPDKAALVASRVLQLLANS